MRLFEVLINNKTLIAPTNGRQFRVVFNILIDFGGFNTYCDMSIYNLSESTAAKAFQRESILGFRAGYENNIDYLFRGQIRNVFKERQGPDTITRIIARGGTSFDKPIINQTLDKNANIVDMIRACCSALGYPPVIDDSQFSDVNVYANGMTISGDPRKYLDKFAQAHDFSYTLDNDKIIIVRNDAFRGGSPVVISEAEGMEGIPEISEVGCDVSTRLNPKLKIGGRIDIQSELRTFNFSNLYFVDVPPSAGVGVYRTFKLEHVGDSWGDSWTTKITSKR